MAGLSGTLEKIKNREPSWKEQSTRPSGAIYAITVGGGSAPLRRTVCSDEYESDRHIYLLLTYRTRRRE
jgi:hypothetical protein